MYRPIWEGVQSSLRDIFKDGFHADKVIQRHLKARSKWGSRDRKLYAEAVYDLVRWWRKLQFASGSESFAAVTEAWCLIHDVPLDRAVPSEGLDPRHVLSVWRDTTLPRAVRESIPDWLDRWGEAQLGARWDSTLQVLNTQAPVFLRANRLKCAPQQLVSELKADGVEAEVVGADCVRLAERANVFLSKSFKLGHFEVQDHGSQQVAPALAADPGERVIDACAGAGGKTLHLAALMKNKGKIIAMDVHDKKLEQLRERSTRAGATVIESRLIDSTKVIKRLKDSADRVLLDVPCSGLGVLRRNPDSKWNLNLEEITRLEGLQAEILRSYASMCRAGGALVYATCSLAPAENTAQVNRFLSQNENWSLEQEHTLWPEKGGQDGFYFARLRRS